MRCISYLLIFLVLMFSPLVTGCGGQVSEEEAARLEALEEGSDSGERADGESEEASQEESGGGGGEQAD